MLHTLQSSEPETFTALAPGAPLPEVPLHQLVHHSTGKGRLSEFSGELLILSFWASWCSSCRYIVPELEALQKTFAGRLRVLLVNAATTGDGEEQVHRFLKGPRIGYRYRLPTVVGDTALHRLFPHKQLPHLVWIRGGRFVAQTGPEALREEHVQTALKDEPLPVRTKQDDPFLVYGQPAPQEADTCGAGASYRSLIYRQGEEAPGTTTLHLDSTTGSSHLKMVGSTLLNLYTYAWKVQLPASQVLFESTEHVPPGAAWCYELLLPCEKTAELRAWMQQDLVRYFGCGARMEKRKMACLILRRAGKKREQPAALIPERGEEKGPLTHYDSPNALARLLSHTLNIPVVDETRREGALELPLIAQLDRRVLQRALARYGLEWAEGRRSLEVFVVRGREKSN